MCEYTTTTNVHELHAFLRNSILMCASIREQKHKLVVGCILFLSGGRKKKLSLHTDRLIEKCSANTDSPPPKFLCFWKVLPFKEGLFGQ